MVEKIRRDVRITTIYEGTSEIMEMTVARDRWQQHLKTRGDHYHAQARELEALHARLPEVGADIAALAHHVLADALEGCRIMRLTRHQHVLLRLGALIAQVEGAAALVRRAAAGAKAELPEKAFHRCAALDAMSRANARDVAFAVATEASRWLAGTQAAGPVAERLPAVIAAQAGLLPDLDTVSDALYGRTPTTPTT